MPDRANRTELHYAALEGRDSDVRALLASGADPNAADDQGFTPLHFAAQGYHVEAAKLLLDAGADVDSVNKFGNTPLWTAVFNCNGSGDLIDLLLGRGADPDRPNQAGDTPRQLAATIGDLDVQQFLPPA